MTQKSETSNPLLLEFEIPDFSSEIKPLVIFDRDDTLIRDIPALASPEEIFWLPGVKESLHLLNQNQVTCWVASNQRAVSNKALTIEDLYKVTANMYRLSLDFGGKLGVFAYCTHSVSVLDQDEVYTCKCRKPQPGLLDFLVENYEVPNIPIFFVGDKETDREAAFSANRKITFIPSHFLQDPLKLLDSLLSGKFKRSDL